MGARRPGSHRDWKAVALPVATVVFLLAALEGAKHLDLLPVFVPSPSQIGQEIITNPALLINLGITAYKAVVGYLIAAAITLAAAAIAIVIRPLYASIYNFGVGLHAIPIIALAPLLALWLGVSSEVQIIIAALACQFPMLVGAMQGLQATDASQRELMHVMSATRTQTLRLVQIPNSLPYLFAGFKIAAPLAVLGAVTAEWAGADSGVGTMMLYALFAYDTTKVWLAVVIACLMAATGYGFWALVEHLAIYWQRDLELAD